MTVLHLLELSLADSVPVDDDAGRFELGGLVEGDKEFPDHGAELFYHLLTVLLYPHRRRVTAGVGIHAPHHLKSMIPIVPQEPCFSIYVKICMYVN